MDDKNIILDKILGMFDEFEDLKKTFEDENDNSSLEKYMDKISFIEEKLRVLKVALLDKESRAYCAKLKKSINDFKRESKFNEYNNKLEFINYLRGLENSLGLIKAIELSYAIDSLYKYVHLNKDDAKTITAKDSVYLNLLANKEGYAKHAQIMSDKARFAYSKDLVRSLLDFSLASYNKSTEPFDLAEKIMIISILDSIKFYLNYR